MYSRTILLHCHIFKNAGTSIDQILTRNFGSGAMVQENDDGTFLHPDKIIAAVEGNEKVVSISSHKMGLPAPVHSDIKFIPLVMIRNPLDRLGSIYAYYKRYHRVINHECLLAKMTTFKDFVEIMFEADFDSGISDLQAHFFLANNKQGAHAPSERSWFLIEETVDSTPCVGLVELFDESMVLWSQYLSKFFPDIDLAYTRENVSADRQKDLDRRLIAVREELGAGLINEFRKRNKIDFSLYDLVRKKIAGEIAAQASFQKSLESFRRKKSSQSLLSDNEVRGYRKSFQVRCWGDEGEEQFVSMKKNEQEISVPLLPREMEALNNDSVRIVGCGVFDHDTGDSLIIGRQGQVVEVVVAVKANKKISSPIVGITIESPIRETIFAMNSFFSERDIVSPEIGETRAYSFIFMIPRLNSGSYSISPAFASGTQVNHSTISHVKNAALLIIPKIIEPRMPGHLYIKNFTVENYEE